MSWFPHSSIDDPPQKKQPLHKPNGKMRHWKQNYDSASSLWNKSELNVNNAAAQLGLNRLDSIYGSIHITYTRHLDRLELWPWWRFLTTSRRHCLSENSPPPLVETVRQRRLRETYLQGLRSPLPRPPALACQNTDFSKRDAARWGKRAAERRKQTGSALDVTFSLLCLHRKSTDILVDFLWVLVLVSGIK